MDFPLSIICIFFDFEEIHNIPVHILGVIEEGYPGPSLIDRLKFSFMMNA